jgi:hypothetical protein
MVFPKLANRFFRVDHFGVRLQKLGLELAKEFLTLLFDDGGIRHRLGSRLGDSGRRFGHHGRNSFVVLAGWADIEIGRKVQMAFRAR